MFRIAIQPDQMHLRRDPRQSFSTRWIELLERDGHEVRRVNVFEHGFLDALRDCDGFLWWFPPVHFLRNYAKRLMLALDHGTDLVVFPDWKSAWHFDDKIAQTYLLQAAGIPTPRTWVFWRERDAIAFCASAQYPLVMKLSAGFYAENVILLRDRREAERWIHRLFGPGVTTLAGPVSRAKKRVQLLLKRLKRKPVSPQSPRRSEKNYLLVQELVPDNAFDTRVTVIGKRAFAYRRLNRPGDFRASGSGLIDFDPSLTHADSVRLAFRAAQTLGADTLCTDVLRQEGKPVLTEISYYFEGWAIPRCPGHWTLRGEQLEWVAGPIRAEDAILEAFLDRLHSRSAGQARSAAATRAL